MIKYRKSDQYYIDQYDRMTIDAMSSIEKKLETMSRYNTDGTLNREHVILSVEYSNKGPQFAKDKEFVIRQLKESDERKDHSIATTPIPKNIRCSVCFDILEFEAYDFINENILFIFKCNDKHLPKKIISTDGTEYVIPLPSCKYCNGKLKIDKVKIDNKIITTETCEVCDRKVEFEIIIPSKKIEPINEDDRRKYCTDYIGKSGFNDDLEKFWHVGQLAQKNENKQYTLDHVNQINIAKMEQILTEQIQIVGFTKILFEKPTKDSALHVVMSAQDTIERDNKASIETLKNTIEKTLFNTNWRLSNTRISYDLGFLTCVIKGYYLETDLIKIAKEIDGVKK